MNLSCGICVTNTQNGYLTASPSDAEKMTEEAQMWLPQGINPIQRGQARSNPTLAPDMDRVSGVATANNTSSHHRGFVKIV